MIRGKGHQRGTIVETREEPKLYKLYRNSENAAATSARG